MPYGNVNVDTVTTSTPQGVLGAGNASIMKNRIINGAMVVNQRALGTTTINSGSAWVYTLDRWSAIGESALGVYTLQQSSTAPAGFINSLLATVTTSASISAGNIYALRQVIEGYNTTDLNWGTANAKTVTLSFQVYSSVTGTFGGVIKNGGNTRSYPFTYTVSTANTWTSISVTIAGDTTGTWATNNTAGIQVLFSLGTGSAFLGTAGTWAGSDLYGATGQTNIIPNSGATFYLTAVQLEVGSSATGFEYVNYQTSLANCQRYYAKMSSTTTYAGFGSGYCSSTSQANAYVKHPVSMRTAPTISQNNLLLITGGAVSAASSITSAYAGIDASTVVVNASSAVLVTGYGVIYCQNSGGSGYLDFSAEL